MFAKIFGFGGAAEETKPEATIETEETKADSVGNKIHTEKIPKSLKSIEKLVFGARKIIF